MTTKPLWAAFAVVIVASFLTLGYAGVRIYQEAPPLPARVVAGGADLIQPGDIQAGQNVWRSMGGMEVGSIWGHGSYVAPDWTADWLHREAVFILDTWSASEAQMPFAQRGPEDQGRLRERLTVLMRANTYDRATDTLRIDPVRAAAFDANLRHYADVFGNGREEYAIPKGALSDPAKQRQLANLKRTTLIEKLKRLEAE
jgi:nitric oxide reductase subunit B